MPHAADLSAGGKMEENAPPLKRRATGLPQSFVGKRMVGAVGIEPSAPLKTRKLFIPRSDKTEKNDRNAEARYTAGTRSRVVEQLN